MASSCSSSDPRKCVCGVGATLQPNLALDVKLEGLLENNKTWVKHVNEADPEFFKILGSGQWPRFLYIGCSDARVEPARLLGLKQGDLFVHRNVGNCCPSDLNFLSVLEYAVNFLKVPHIVVMGHYDCGAVRNSDKVQDIGLLENWIRQIRDVHRVHGNELKAIPDAEAKHRRLVELNVIEQARNVLKTACVQRRRAQSNEQKEGNFEFETPCVHAFVFDPADGIVKSLDDEIGSLDDIYTLMETK